MSKRNQQLGVQNTASRKEQERKGGQEAIGTRRQDQGAKERVSTNREDVQVVIKQAGIGKPS